MNTLVENLVDLLLVHLNTLERLLALSRALVVLSTALVVVLDRSVGAGSYRSSRGGAAGDLVHGGGLGVPLVGVGGAAVADDGHAGGGLGDVADGCGGGLEGAVAGDLVGRNRDLGLLTVVVVIDGGFGGVDGGAVAGDGVGRVGGVGLSTVIIVIINLGGEGSTAGHGAGGSSVVREGGGRVLGLLLLVAVSVDGLGLGLESGDRSGSIGGLNGSSRAGDRGASSSGSEKAGDTGPGGLLLVIIGVEKSLAVALKDTGDPAVLISDAPDSNTNTALNIETRSNNVGVLVTLSLQLSSRGGNGLVADIKLGVGDLDIKSSEALEHGDELRTRGGLADNEMALETNTINGSTGLLDDLDKLDGTVGLLAVLLEIVVVVLGGGVGLPGSLEGDGEVVSSKSLVKDTVSPLSAVVNGLVDYIPSVAVALVVLNNVGNVSLDDLGELTSRELSSRNYTPVRTNTPQNHTLNNSPQAGSWLCQIRNDVGGGVNELALSRLDGLPLLAVLGDELAKLLDVVGELLVRSVAQVSVVDGAAEVLESSGLRQAVKLGRDWARGQESEDS
ncbi:hypothetical protein HG530_007644 [Fusarium avenaceum]|nr:hypothetical protein HG530_007644 [Fusarium avenaceum]